MTTTITQDLLDTLPATICEILPGVGEPASEFGASRDARVTAANGLACIEMDDVGYGAFSRMTSNDVADKLVAAGLVRDAR